MKGSVTSLINQPAMLASSLMGRCPAFHRYAIPGQHLHGTVWRSDSNVAMPPPQADRDNHNLVQQSGCRKNIATLNYVMLAAQTYRAEAASQALTAALDFSRRMDNAGSCTCTDAPSTTTGTASGASAYLLPSHRDSWR